MDDDQNGFISNIYIYDNIRLIYDLKNYLIKKGLLLCTDVEKAFDTLYGQCMFKVLKSLVLETMCVDG